MSRSMPMLTDDEATFLALLTRAEPATAYQLSKIYETSPISSFGTSKGKIYPLVRRLTDWGMVRGKTVPGDQRGSEMLRCTAKGRTAVRNWIKHIKPAHFLLEDPLRTMVQSFNLLDENEQLQWVASARAGLVDQLDEVRSYQREVTGPFHEQVFENALLSIKGRLKWLDHVEKAILSN